MRDFPRNVKGLDERQIELCKGAWTVLAGDEPDICPLDTSQAHQNMSRTRFSDDHYVVFLGADAFPGDGWEALSRMSMLAVLAHEWSHAVRYKQEYKRPFDLPDVLIDEAETSLAASFMLPLNPTDRVNLREDARDRLDDWFLRPKRGDSNEG